MLILDEESDIFLLIFNAMKKFSAHDEVQKLGCKALHVLFERGILICQILYFYIYIRDLYKKKRFIMGKVEHNYDTKKVCTIY